MKIYRFIFIALNVIIFSMHSLHTNGQHSTFYSKPGIYLIDDAEKFFVNRHNSQWLEKYGKEWLIDFYDALENDTVNPRYDEIMNGSGRVLKSVLDDDNITFMINGWLYVLSYEPNAEKSHNDEDYKKIEKRRVWLYKKNVKTDSDWELANFNPVFQHAITYGKYNADAFSLSPYRENRGGSSDVIKFSSLINVVAILCGIEINYGKDFYLINKLLVLSPVVIRDDGSIHFEFEEFCGLYNYPSRFTGMLDGGKTINTIDNNGKEKNIYFYLGNDINDQPNHVYFYGDYGFSKNLGR